jgi:hypothetical protein
VSDCGGCRGEGSHRRWCIQKVGIAAHVYGTEAEKAESIGDSIGANDPGLANMAYRLSGELRAKAIERRTDA